MSTLYRGSIRWYIRWNISSVWTKTSVNNNVAAIFVIMDYNSIRQIGADYVYHSIFGWFLLLNCINGDSGNCHNFSKMTIRLGYRFFNFTSVKQVYISEIASPDIRGSLSAIQKISGHLGILISYSLGAYLDWRQLAMLVSIAPMMLFLTVIYIPETPSFLVLKGRDEEAYRYVFLVYLTVANK